ncbi:MAG TPA: VOC family protein [bacterium]|nr:VOC family protein [bacterium]HMW35488.1 VOC family protein [bacterium]HMY36041.1 VOC family protein [bacterium]HMZ03241.1 VOC family protein [bacterium]HNB10885.1 VOC family protein [bacterium]
MRIHFITLGVSDMQRAANFYSDVLGFKILKKTPVITFFDNGGMVLGVYPIQQLNALTGASFETVSPSSTGILLSHNVQNENDVDAWVNKLKNEKVKILKEAQPAVWGGRHAFFSDPDGYSWEICWNPKLIPDEFEHLPLVN